LIDHRRATGYRVYLTDYDSNNGAMNYRRKNRTLLSKNRYSRQKDDKMRLDKEEQEILASVEAGEWLPVDDQEARTKKYREIAKATFRKDSRISPTRSSGF